MHFLLLYTQLSIFICFSYVSLILPLVGEERFHRFLLAKLQAWREVMAAYRRVYDSRHLMADYQEPGSAPEPYARQSSMGYLYLLH